MARSCTEADHFIERVSQRGVEAISCVVGDERIDFVVFARFCGAGRFYG